MSLCRCMKGRMNELVAVYIYTDDNYTMVIMVYLQ